MKSSRCLLPIAGLLVGTGLLFGLFPSLDLDISQRFGATGFPLKANTLAIALRQTGQWLPLIVFLACLAALLGPLANPRWRNGFDARNLAAILLTFTLGPGLLINVGLKDHWHRPRPIQVSEFGGASSFKPWWDTSGACQLNCSFASGEVAAATAAVGVVTLIPSAYAGAALVLGVILTLIVAYLRLAFGGHFLSDIVFAALLTQFVACALTTLFHSQRWRYGCEGVLEQDIRLLAFRLHAQLPWLRHQPHWLVRSAHLALGKPAFSPTLGSVTVIGWERADDHAGVYGR
ncbi:phosphatase PAP2 family protein [Labrys miyagiensis]|uniref:Phosphatase PAP2 family protein n=1 Tax=Labrys miyagiensis TaxID=346912 RepID=A0ABQ6CU62_9HYPH|nr:phosphatase PAP2 family protein [Labrys miyagiensis]GLS23310.1 phosphatase PAP2 family protein [Labrys miyagiensis]